MSKFFVLFKDNKLVTVTEDSKLGCDMLVDGRADGMERADTEAQVAAVIAQHAGTAQVQPTAAKPVEKLEEDTGLIDHVLKMTDFVGGCLNTTTKLVLEHLTRGMTTTTRETIIKQADEAMKKAREAGEEALKGLRDSLKKAKGS